ncbi:MAG: hypothetical protein AAGH68_00635 [Pseudomonadota bacterium]
MRRVRLNGQPSWLRRDYWATRWRVERIPVPYVLSDRGWHRWAAQSLCWLKPEAQEYVSDLRYLAWLMTEAGVPIREIRTRRPGAIYWEDDHQIVAKPEGRLTPRAF